MSRRNSKSITARKKHEDLRPWLDYFDMFSQYVKCGYLQMDIAKHEAYTTQPALHAMSEGENPAEQIQNGSIARTALHIREYAAWLSAEGNTYLQENFALHIVKPDEPHDLMFTILFSRKRKLFKRKMTVDIIAYPDK